MAVAGINHLWFHICILMTIFAISRSEDAADCVYTFYIKTASLPFAGTDSKVSAAFYDKSGYGIAIGNVETWGGRMGPRHDYFEKGSLDIFSGKGPCLQGPVCALNLSIDGSGALPRWRPQYLEITTMGDKKPCAKQFFSINQALSRLRLSAVRDNCRKSVVKGGDSNSPASPSFVAVM